MWPISMYSLIIWGILMYSPFWLSWKIMKYQPQPTSWQTVAWGPLVNNCETINAIDMAEFNVLQNVETSSSIHLDPKTQSLSSNGSLKFGTGTNFCARRRMIGSVNISFNYDNKNTVLIRHTVAQGSSQWIVGRNCPCVSNDLHYYSYQNRYFSGEWLSRFNGDYWWRSTH